MKKLMLAAALAVVSGCMARAPVLRLEKSTMTIRHAEEAGAFNVPLAKAHLLRAREEQEVARRLANARDPRAETLMACSEADAELALALAREAQLRHEAVKAQNELAELKWKRGSQ